MRGPVPPACSKRAFIVTDPPLFELGMGNIIIEKLLPMGIQPKTFTNVEPDPTLGMATRVRQGSYRMSAVRQRVLLHLALCSAPMFWVVTQPLQGSPLCSLLCRLWLTPYGGVDMLL